MSKTNNIKIIGSDTNSPKNIDWDDYFSPNKPNTAVLKQLFVMLVQLTPPISDIIPINLIQSAQDSETQSINPGSLASIFDSYKGKLSDKTLALETCMASLCHIRQPLDLENPSDEWRLISRLCQMICYFMLVKNHRRLYAACNFLRRRSNPMDKHSGVWQLCIDQFSSDQLEGLYQQVCQFEENELSAHSATEQTMLNDFRLIVEDCATGKLPSKREAKTRGRDKRGRKSLVYEDVGSSFDDEIDRVQLTEQLVWERANKKEKFEDIESDERKIRSVRSINPETLSVAEQSSPALAKKRINAALAHANKNERMHLTNTRQLTQVQASIVCHELVKRFNNNQDELIRQAAALLLLIVCTGRDFDSMLAHIKHIYSKDESIFNKDQPLFNINILISSKSSIPDGAQINTGGRAKLPLPASLHQTLIDIYQKFNASTQGLDEAEFTELKQTVNKLITKIREEKQIPYLSIHRLATLLYRRIWSMTGNSQLATIITGRNDKKQASTFYCSVSYKSIHDSYLDALASISPALSEQARQSSDALELMACSPAKLGSYHVVDPQIVTTVMSELLKRAQAQLQNYIDKPDFNQMRACFNAYTAWLWQLSLLLTTLRPVIGSPGVLKNLQLQLGIMYVNDKDQRSSGSARTVPLCRFLVDEINAYLAFLRWIQATFKHEYQQINHAINEIFVSQRSLLNVMDEQGRLNEISPIKFTEVIGEQLPLPANWNRHFGESYLRGKAVPEPLIFAIYGHELAGQEMLRTSSSIGLGQIKSVAYVFDQMVEELGLQGIGDVSKKWR